MFVLIWKHKAIIEEKDAEIAKLKATNNKLLLELMKAKKNDTPKDPKTGKFVSKKKCSKK